MKSTRRYFLEGEKYLGIVSENRSDPLHAVKNTLSICEKYVGTFEKYLGIFSKNR